ncbi:MAG: Gldg family protein [Amaricoccus sp.]
MRETLNVARKEFRGYFASPAAYLFIGAFLAVNLFIFFWVEAFFARDIADVRPLFKWMPLLQVFLCAALTMRSWSEERRAGTLETLLTAPVRPLSLVLGKFLATLALVALALLLTLPLPVTVSLLGPLDWGPVIGGYVATLFLAAAYVSIGLFVSARSDNAIVALIVSTLACGFLYLIGSAGLTSLFNRGTAELLAAVGSGSRFDSITRGVLDLRDLYYYLSIVGVFLTLNVFQLERLRWAGNPTQRQHLTQTAVTALVVANFLAANLWLAPVAAARADMTEAHRFTLSDSTKSQLAGLQEPLVIRGFFSSKTHPLLAPLVPQLKDLLTEYQVAGGDRVRVEFLNPSDDPDAEKEAADAGISPVPFQTADRFQSAIVSSYFNLQISYGDQNETLGYQDLVEVKQRGANQLDVALKNPEYVVTRAIRKATQGYRAGGDAFSALAGPVTFHGYLSDDAALPDDLKPLKAALTDVLNDMKAKSGGKLQVAFEDPAAGDGTLADKLGQDYGLRPMVASLTDPTPFWFSMMLESGNQAVPVPIPDTLDKPGLQRAIDAALQRLAPGFLRTVAVVQPPAGDPEDPMMQGSGRQFQQLEQALGDNARVVDADLSTGKVPDATDLLLVLAPSQLDDKSRLAIDQFLMRGGAVVLATSPFGIEADQTLAATPQVSGLSDWLASYGVRIDPTFVLDPQNAALPVPVQRDVGGMPVQQVQMMPYPHFPDLRGDELAADSPVTAGLEELTLNWASPIELDTGKVRDLKVTKLLTSSPQSWTSDKPDVIPDYDTFPDSGFAVDGKRGPQVLAVALTGRFPSFYAGKDSPLLTAPPPPPAADGTTPPAADAKPPVTDVIDRSPDSARLVVIASNTFGSDLALSLASEGMGTQYTKPVDFLENVIDWSLEDPALLSLRGRSEFASTLAPESGGNERLWEYANYALALAGLALVWGWRRAVARSDRARYARIIEEARA